MFYAKRRGGRGAPRHGVQIAKAVAWDSSSMAGEQVVDGWKGEDVVGKRNEASPTELRVDQRFRSSSCGLTSKRF